MSIKVYGASLSPYVRKVRLALALKQLDYEQIQVIPMGDDQPQEFKDNSPLGKIPLLFIDDIWLSDSTAILAYLERSRSATPLLSSEPKLAAQAIWFEQYAVAPMTPAISGHLFAELILAPAMFKRESNQEEIELAKTVEIPAIFDYLESQLSSEYLIGDAVGHADICVGTHFFTLAHCGVSCDAGRWPKTAAYIDRLMSNPVFAPIFKQEQQALAAMAG